MISGTNPSNVNLDEPTEYSSVGLTNITDVITNLQKRRDNVLSGGVNCIPLPFPRFRNEVPGIEQGQYVIVTASEKTGKSSLASFVYVYEPLDFAFENPDKCSVHIIYFALEEAVQRVIERYMSHLLYKLDGIRISPKELRSTSADNPIPQEIIDKLNSEEYQKRLRFFEECVQFETEDTNPTGMLRKCEAYAKTVGVYKSHKIVSKGKSSAEVEVFDSYTQSDPNHYKIAFIDHIGLVDKEQGFKTKDSIDKISEYAVKYLRNRYNYTIVNIQQQASESQGLDAIKQKRMMPSTAYLADSKYTGRDANLVIGLFDPSRFGLPTWLDYIIQDKSDAGLGTYGRFAYVLANRDGEMGGVCPLFFDGAVCNFEELPKPTDVHAMQPYYQKAKDFRTERQKIKVKQLTLLMFFKRIIDWI